MNEKLYLCQSDFGNELLTRAEVDEHIRDWEEKDIDPEFTILGVVNVAELNETNAPYLMVAKIGTANYYDIVIAENKEEASTKLLSKKRMNKATIVSIRDISELVKSYYE